MPAPPRPRTNRGNSSSQPRRPTNGASRGGGSRPAGDRRPARVEPIAPALTPRLPPELGPEFAAKGAVLVRAVLLAPVALAVIGIVLLVLVSPILGAVLLVLGLAVAVANLLLGSSARLLNGVGGTLLVATEEPRLVNLVEGLCVANGLAVPELRVLEDRAPNAIVLGAKADRAVLVLTRGLLDLLDRIELEAVVAHELAHVKRGDLELAQRATAAAGLAVRVAPAAALAVLRLADGGREALADGAAAIMTRYPPGLVAALAKLAVAPATRPSGLSPTTARLTAARWCAPLAEAEQDRVVAGVLDLELRLAALAER